MKLKYFIFAIFSSHAFDYNAVCAIEDVDNDQIIKLKISSNSNAEIVVDRSAFEPLLTNFLALIEGIESHFIQNFAERIIGWFSNDSFEKISQFCDCLRFLKQNIDFRKVSFDQEELKKFFEIQDQDTFFNRYFELAFNLREFGKLPKRTCFHYIPFVLAYSISYYVAKINYEICSQMVESNLKDLDLYYGDLKKDLQNFMDLTRKYYNNPKYFTFVNDITKKILNQFPYLEEYISYMQDIASSGNIEVVSEYFNDMITGIDEEYKNLKNTYARWKQEVQDSEKFGINRTLFAQIISINHEAQYFASLNNLDRFNLVFAKVFKQSHFEFEKIMYHETIFRRVEQLIQKNVRAKFRKLEWLDS